MTRLRPKLAQVAGARLFLFPRQDLRMGGRQSFAQYQYTLQGDTADELYAAAPRLVEALQKNPVFADVTSDQQEGGLESRLVIDRATPIATASRRTRSTTPSTTPSASGRSRRSTTR